MFNQFVLNIKANSNWSKDPPSLIINRGLLFLVFLGVLNFLIEFFVRYYLPGSQNVFLIHLSHIFIFFLYPSFLIFRKWTKPIALSLSLAIIVIPIYFLINKGLIPFYFAFFFTSTWVFLFIFFKKYKKYLGTIFLGNTNWVKSIFVGLGAGILFCLHIMTVLFFFQDFLLLDFNLQKVFINFFLEVGFSLIGMEFFFRYLLFLRIRKRNNFSFTQASFLSTILFLLPFLGNPSFNSDTVFVVGSIYYILMQGFISCWMAEKTNGILASVFFNLTLSIFLSVVFK